VAIGKVRLTTKLTSLLTPATLHSIDEAGWVWSEDGRRSICIGPLINV
jgi:hypothetical protein